MTASKHSWKSATFFDATLLDTQQKLDKCSIACNDQVIIKADESGKFQTLDKSKLDVIHEWIGFEKCKCLHLEFTNGMLIALGENTSNYPVVKCWTLGDQPRLVFDQVIQHNSEPHPISAFAASQNLSTLAIGLANGTVVLIRKFRESLQHAEPIRHLCLLIHPINLITGLVFGHKADVLFISTTSSLFVSNLTLKGNQAATPLDDIGCPMRCLQASPISSASLVLARDEALYLYGIEGRRATYALEGSKILLKQYQNYLILCTTSKGGSTDAITVIDIKFKFVVYKNDSMQRVLGVSTLKDEIYIFCEDGKVYLLTEISTEEKLSRLYSKNLYSLALDLLSSKHINQEAVLDIHSHYGDYLFDKNDYDLAILEYCQAIGHVQSSSVIRKFLDKQQFHHMVKFLQELHYKGHANTEYTTLLLNCLIKIKDTNSLNLFIEQSQTTDVLNFELDTAIRVLRQAGYIEHALQLSAKYRRHDDYLKIQIEDKSNFAMALSYLEQLPAADVESYLYHYGKMLIETVCEDTTRLLTDLCVGNYKPRSAESTLSKKKIGFNALATSTINYIGYKPSSHSSQSSSVEEENSYLPPSPRRYFSHFVKVPKQLVTFIEALVKAQYDLRGDDNANIKTIEATYTAPESLDFDEASALMSTLLEMYLKVAESENVDDERAIYYAKALALIDKHDQLPIDLNQALVICTIESFDDGKLKLWCIMGLFEEVIYFHIDRYKEAANLDDKEDALKQILGSIALHGRHIPHMYVVVLEFLVNEDRNQHKQISKIQKLLDDIGSLKTELQKSKNANCAIRLPDESEVIEIVGNSGISIGALKEWMITSVRENEEKSKVDELLFYTYREESKKKQDKLKDLGDGNRPQSVQNTRCASTGERLELPAIHFACGHSYNVASLAENESECPICARSHGVIRELRKNQRELIERHDIFLNGVQTEGFDLISLNFANKLF